MKEGNKSERESHRSQITERERTGLPQRAKQPVTSERHNRSQITDHTRKKEKERERQKEGKRSERHLNMVT